MSASSAMRMHFCTFERFGPNQKFAVSTASNIARLSAGPRRAKKFRRPRHSSQLTLCSCHGFSDYHQRNPLVETAATSDELQAINCCDQRHDDGCADSAPRTCDWVNCDNATPCPDVSDASNSQHILADAPYKQQNLAGTVEPNYQVALVEGRRIFIVSAAPWPKQSRVNTTEQYKSYQMGWTGQELDQMREQVREKRESAAVVKHAKETQRFEKPVYCLPKNLVSENKTRLLRWFRQSDPADAYQ